jgi:membrane protein YdbS with pleckstrin-like domain
MRRTQVAALTFVVAALAGAAAGLSFGTAVGAGVAAFALLAGVLTDRFVQRRVRAWAYREREDDLLVRRGVLITRLSVVPYGRMQFVDVVAGPVERSFGLATVRMHTAAAASDARIPGLDQAEADRLRDQLSALGEAKAAGL